MISDQERRLLELLSIWLATGLGAVTMAAGQTPATSPEPVALNAGDHAPVFSLPGSDGKTHRLSDDTFKGKTVVLAWFPKAFTGG